MTSRPATQREFRPAAIERLLALRVAINWEVAIYVAIFAAALALRFWDLGGRSLHHDESIHAQWSWRLIQGDYTHDPIFHGPFYYHVQGLVFLLFGATDYTARVSAAMFGTALVALPLLLRRRLGPVGTVAAVSFIAFSPTIVYYSRFFREDIYMAFFTMAMVAAMWRYLADGRERWLIALALAFTGSITTKEATFITTAVFLVFLNAQLAVDLANDTLRARDGDTRGGQRALLAAGLFPWAWAIVALWPFLPPLKRRFSWEVLPRSGDLLILLGTLTLPLLTAFLKTPLENAGIVEKGRLVCSARIPRADATALVGLFAVTGSAAAFVGLQWRPKTWAIAAGLSVLAYLTLMTSLWTNLNGLCTGPWGSLDYWLTQQDVARGNQPWFYYDMLMPAYEFLPLVICLGGLWWSTVRGNSFSRFLVLWIAGVWLALSAAGEKMPWLNTHIALPACILAAWTVNRAWQAWNPRPSVPRIIWPLFSVATIAMGALVAIAFLPGGGGYSAVRLAIAVLAGGFIVYAARPFGRRAAPAFLVLATVGALAFFSLRTMTMAVYERGDVPKDLLIYTQSAPDIPQIRDQIDALASATGQGALLPIAVDDTDSFAWPWAWYLRDYKRVSYVNFTDGPPAGEFAVMLVNQSNVGRVNDALARTGDSRFGSPTKYPHRWWFDEVYKEALRTGPREVDTWRTIADGVFHGSWLDTWFHYWRDHEPGLPSGSVDAFAYFPANFDRSRGVITARPIEAPKPGNDRAGRQTFGGIGSFPGQFFAPVDIESDAEGNLYVIDSASRKLQKFDRNGNFLASVDVRVNPDDPSEQAQPWGLGIAANGDVVVADTFGWRVRVFDRDLKPTTVVFGQAPDTSRAPGDFDLFGPRDVAVDAQGNLWVTDTGNDRIMVYSPAGAFLRQVGTTGAGRNQFDEPVGLAIARDGTIFVADMFNRRVVMLDASGNSGASFNVEGWGGQDAADKPYLRPLRDGRVAVSLPMLNEVRIYDRAGAVASLIRPTDEPLARPYGIVENPDGKLWIVEGGSGRVRLFSIP